MSAGAGCLGVLMSWITGGQIDVPLVSPGSLPAHLMLSGAPISQPEPTDMAKSNQTGTARRRGDTNIPGKQLVGLLFQAAWTSNAQFTSGCLQEMWPLSWMSSALAFMDMFGLDYLLYT